MPNAPLSGYGMRIFDIAGCFGDDRPTTERAEAAIRMAVAPGARLLTPTARGQFSVTRYTTDDLVLLLGDRQAWTPRLWKGSRTFSEAEDGS